MNSDSNKLNTQGINRRHLLTAGAAGLAAAGLGAGKAQAKTVIPDPENTAVKSSRGTSGSEKFPFWSVSVDLPPTVTVTSLTGAKDSWAAEPPKSALAWSPT